MKMTRGYVTIKRSVLLLIILWTTMSFNCVYCNDTFIKRFDNNINEDHNMIHEKIDNVSSSMVVVRAEQHPLMDDEVIDDDDNTNDRIDNMDVKSLNDIFKNYNNRHIMTDVKSS